MISGQIRGKRYQINLFNKKTSHNQMIIKGLSTRDGCRGKLGSKHCVPLLEMIVFFINKKDSSVKKSL